MRIGVLGQPTGYLTVAVVDQRGRPVPDIGIQATVPSWKDVTPNRDHFTLWHDGQVAIALASEDVGANIAITPSPASGVQWKPFSYTVKPGDQLVKITADVVPAGLIKGSPIPEGLLGLGISAGLIGLGIGIFFLSMQRGKMPADMRAVFKKPVRWYESTTPGLIVSGGLGLLGTYGLIKTVREL